MKHAAVVVGVNKTGHLPLLMGAVSGAKDFAQWARGQGMDVTLLIDEGGKEVTLQDVRDAVRKITGALVYQKLVIFFSGHGFLLTADTELWLLSRSPDPETEAVNVQLSATFARDCGIPHIIFVSDACRSGGATHSHRRVKGAAIFPNRPIKGDTEIDFFYATRPGDTALEVREADAVGNYKGIFTDCLLEALRGHVPKVVEKVQEANFVIRWLIPSRPLKFYLAEAVPQKAQEVDIKLNQNPQVIPESSLPKYFGELTKAPEAARDGGGVGPVAPSPPGPELGDFATNLHMSAMSFNVPLDLSTLPTVHLENRLFLKQMASIASARGRESFETRTGFTVHGHISRVAIGSGVKFDIEHDNEMTHVRIYKNEGDPDGNSIAIQLQSGLGTVLGVQPGFVGTVLLEQDRIVNVNYTPARYTKLYDEEYQYEADRIEQRRAFAAAASRHGVFRLDSDEAQRAGEYLRMMKRLDPTLGLYASYAYSQAGKVKQVRSVLSYMLDHPPVPFDVLLLARSPDVWKGNAELCAPFGPMLRQGWALLELLPDEGERLREYARYLLPSLWVTFEPEGMDRIMHALEKGNLK
jgi:hypothetical protein